MSTYELTPYERLLAEMITELEDLALAAPPADQHRLLADAARLQARLDESIMSH